MEYITKLNIVISLMGIVIIYFYIMYMKALQEITLLKKLQKKEVNK